MAQLRTGDPVLLHSCRTIVTGDLMHPTAMGDTILVADGRIAAIGRRAEIDAPPGTTLVDAAGHDAIPGLIDPHVHPEFGDWTARMSTVGWMAAYAQAGVTTALSQGAFMVPNYPHDRAGTVALTIALARAYRGFRPGGLKMHGAAVSLVESLDEDDFAALAGEGVWLIAEIAAEGLAEPAAVRRMLAIAHRHGFRSRVHFGPKAVGHTTVSAEMAAAMGAQIASHVNGGPNAPPLADVDFLLERTDYGLELCYTGNPRVAVYAARCAREAGALDRLMLGSDSPTGAGILPRAILRMMGLLAGFAEIPPAQAVAIGTGNTARWYGLNTGRLEVGREADILLIDAPRDSVAEGGLEAIEVGDLPSIGLLMIDGAIVSLQTANTLPGKRRVTVAA